MCSGCGSCASMSPACPLCPANRSPTSSFPAAKVRVDIYAVRIVAMTKPIVIEVILRIIRGVVVSCRGKQCRGKQ
jgi:hypothetical protein